MELLKLLLCAFLLSVLAGLQPLRVVRRGAVALLLPLPYILYFYAAAADGCFSPGPADHHDPCPHGWELAIVSLALLVWLAVIVTGLHCGRLARRW